MISVADTTLLKDIFSQTGRDSWAYFAPFLACYSLPPKRALYLTEKHDLFCLFQYSGRINSERIDLVIPPSTLTREVKAYLLKTKDLLQQVNMRILWVDSSDINTLNDLERDMEKDLNKESSSEDSYVENCLFSDDDR